MSSQSRERWTERVHAGNGVRPGTDQSSPCNEQAGSGDNSSAQRANGRTRAERVSLAISSVILLALTGLILFLYFSGGSSEAVIEVRPQFTRVQQRSAEYYLPLTVKNTGDATAEDVIVELTLTSSGGRREASEITIGFLPGNGSEDATVVFGEDPRNGDMSVDIKSYLNP